jgi:hypothetical protein
MASMGPISTVQYMTYSKYRANGSTGPIVSTVHSQ